MKTSVLLLVALASQATMATQDRFVFPSQTEWKFQSSVAGHVAVRTAPAFSKDYKEIHTALSVIVEGAVWRPDAKLLRSVAVLPHARVLMMESPFPPTSWHVTIECRDVREESIPGTEAKLVLTFASTKFVQADMRIEKDGSVLESLREIGGMEEVPNQPPQRNAGSRPSSDDSSASETPSSLGPRG